MVLKRGHDGSPAAHHPYGKIRKRPDVPLPHHTPDKAECQADGYGRILISLKNGLNSLFFGGLHDSVDQQEKRSGNGPKFIYFFK